MHTVVEHFLTSYKLYLAKRSSEKMFSEEWCSLKIALRETICKKLKSVPPLCVTSSECRALFRVENIALSNVCVCVCVFVIFCHLCGVVQVPLLMLVQALTVSQGGVADLGSDL